MEFKLIIQNNNKQEASELKFEVRPGVEMVAHFFGFAVFMRPEGCVLILPSEIRQTIRDMVGDQDRVILSVPGDAEQQRQNYETLRRQSLEWYPKDEVDPKE